MIFCSDNIISLDVYFEDLSYDIIEQTPLYEIWALIGKHHHFVDLFMSNCTNRGNFVYNQVGLSINVTFFRSPDVGEVNGLVVPLISSI